MKTLREVIFERHQAAAPKLDAIREKVVAGLAADTSAEAAARSKRMVADWQRAGSTSPVGWRQFLWSLRWHLAGVSAAWVVAMLLSIDPAPASAQRVAQHDTPSPQQLLAALRENQRQLRELIATPAGEPAPEPRKPTLSPHSQRESFSTGEA